MDLTREKQQRDEFREILFELSKSQELLQDASYRHSMYKRLENLYDAETKEKRFRHFYSDIFSVLTLIQQNEEQGNIDVLGENLKCLRNGYQPLNKAEDGERLIDVSDALKKLYDHVSLDIARILYSDSADRKISGESTLEELQTKINSLEIGIERTYVDTEQKMDEVEKRLKNSQNEYITILGIFASIVLAFVGGMTFSTSVLSNIDKVSIFRLLAVIDLLGFVLINTVYILLKFIFRINDRDTKDFSICWVNILMIFFGILILLAWIYKVDGMRLT